MTERDWYVSYDKTFFGRENGRYIKEQSEQLMNSLFALFFKDVDNCLSFTIPYKYFFNKVVWATTFVRFLLLPPPLTPNVGKSL